MSQDAEQQEFVGYGPAAVYLGIRRNTLTSYCSAGRQQGPRIKRREIVKGWALPVFDRDELDRWLASRPGQGARTDLAGRSRK